MNSTEPSSAERPLVVAPGPTGSGKRNAALTIAEDFKGEIVNAASMQAA